jgi:hypothetical protein
MAGIEDTSVVDLVTHDEQTGEYALIMVASQPWSDTDEQLTRLLQKIYNYLSFALDEGLVTAFPDASGKPLRIQLDCVTRPTESVRQVIEHARPRLDEHNIRFVVNTLR